MTWTTVAGRKKLRRILEKPLKPHDPPTIFGGGDMKELLDALEAAEARHVRYLNGIEAPLRGVRKYQESGEPAASDANEIWNLVGRLRHIAALFRTWTDGDEPEGVASAQRMLLQIGEVLAPKERRVEEAEDSTDRAESLRAAQERCKLW